MAGEHPSEASLLAYVEDELDAVRARRSRRHLAGCEACAAAVALSRAGREALRGAPLLEPTGRLRRRVEEEIAPRPPSPVGDRRSLASARGSGRGCARGRGRDRDGGRDRTPAAAAETTKVPVWTQRPGTRERPPPAEATRPAASPRRRAAPTRIPPRSTASPPTRRDWREGSGRPASWPGSRSRRSSSTPIESQTCGARSPAIRAAASRFASSRPERYVR